LEAVIVFDNKLDLSKCIAILTELKAEVEQQTDNEKREVIIVLIDWFFKKMEEWQEKRKRYEAAFDELEQSRSFDDTEPDHFKRERQLMENYLDHLKKAGCLFHIYHAIEIIKTEGENWENDPTAMRGVLNQIVSLWG
jgi:hypothetical protein